MLVELAALLHENGNLQEAEELSRRALAIRDRILGAQHPDVAAALLGKSSINKFSAYSALSQFSSHHLSLVSLVVHKIDLC